MEDDSPVPSPAGVNPAEVALALEHVRVLAGAGIDIPTALALVAPNDETVRVVMRMLDQASEDGPSDQQELLARAHSVALQEAYGPFRQVD